MFGWKQRGANHTSKEHGATAVQCGHVALVPHWDSLADMGHQDRVSFFRCDACGTVFTPAEAFTLRHHQAEQTEFDATPE